VTRPLFTGARPKIVLSRRERPGAEQSGDAENLAASKRERRGPWHQLVDLQQRLSGFARTARVQIADASSHHHPDDLVAARLRGRPFAGVDAVAQHDEPIRHLLHFLDEMRDVDDRVPLLLESRIRSNNRRTSS
jgi:hypothetical protein